MQNSNILIVEDEALVAEDLKAHIIEMGYQVSAIIDNGEDAIAFLEGSRPDLVMMDIVLKGEADGIDVATVIKQRHHIPVIFLTAYTDREKLERAREAEPYGYLVKPFDEQELQMTIGMALYKAKADRCLRESQRWTQAVLCSIADAVLTVDHNGQVRSLNAMAKQLTGWVKATAIGHNLNEVMALSSDGQQAQLSRLVIDLLGKKVSAASLARMSAELLPVEGEAIPIEMTMGLIKYDDGNHDGLVIAFRDVTLQQQARHILEQNNAELEVRVQQRTQELQQANDELIIARQRIEEASAAKSRFLATMSHELRTPLNPIIGFAELFKMDHGLSAMHHEMADEIYASGKQLFSLINDVMFIAQSDTSGIQLQSAPFDIAEIVRYSMMSHASAADRKGLELTCKIPDIPPPFVEGDSGRIQEVLNRLLENAIRFTPQGKVQLILDYAEADNRHIMVRLSIVDTGIGVADKQRIFDPLTQIDDGLTRKCDGIGMGLTITLKLVELMGGRIGVEDNPGGGSCFWVELKLALSVDI